MDVKVHFLFDCKRFFCPKIDSFPEDVKQYDSHKTSLCTAQLHKTLWELSKDSISLKSQWPCLPKQALPHYTQRRPLTPDYRGDVPSQSHSSSVARGVSEPSKRHAGRISL